MTQAIVASNLTKLFKVRIKSNKKSQNFIRFFSPKYETVEAVNNINFEIKEGERVAFIGPNGSGKSTTIKMLTGIFSPNEGEASILGHNPYRDRKQVLHQIGTLFGQRSQLWYHLPAIHSYQLLKTIYQIEDKVFNSRLALLIEEFELKSLIRRPVKELSLGQRMRCEITASLLHNPKILFLDEPTIGLDLLSKSRVRELLLKCSVESGTTLFLTSHDTSDIETVCDRVILVNNGEIVFDLPSSQLNKRFHRTKKIRIHTKESVVWKPTPGLNLKENKGLFYTFSVDEDAMSVQKAIQLLYDSFLIHDISIETPSLEETIKTLYTSL
tara:strand:+ start:7797 stop:8777 length:981 start_codon:yes stop_codon:yes gene_type:complete